MLRLLSFHFNGGISRMAIVDHNTQTLHPQMRQIDISWDAFYVQNASLVLEF